MTKVATPAKLSAAAKELVTKMHELAQKKTNPIVANQRKKVSREMTEAGLILESGELTVSAANFLWELENPGKKKDAVAVKPESVKKDKVTAAPTVASLQQMFAERGIKVEVIDPEGFDVLLVVANGTHFNNAKTVVAEKQFPGVNVIMPVNLKKYAYDKSASVDPTVAKAEKILADFKTDIDAMHENAINTANELAAKKAKSKVKTCSDAAATKALDLNKIMPLEYEHDSDTGVIEIEVETADLELTTKILGMYDNVKITGKARVELPTLRKDKKATVKEVCDELLRGELLDVCEVDLVDNKIVVQAPSSQMVYVQDTVNPVGWKNISFKVSDSIPVPHKPKKTMPAPAAPAKKVAATKTVTPPATKPGKPTKPAAVVATKIEKSAPKKPAAKPTPKVEVKAAPARPAKPATKPATKPVAKSEPVAEQKPLLKFKPGKDTDWDKIAELLPNQFSSKRDIISFNKKVGDATLVLQTRGGDRLVITEDFRVAFESTAENVVDYSDAFKSLAYARKLAGKIVNLMTA